MINQQRYNSLATEHQQTKKHDNRTSHKTTVNPISLCCTTITKPNEIDSQLHAKP